MFHSYHISVSITFLTVQNISDQDWPWQMSIKHFVNTTFWTIKNGLSHITTQHDRDLLNINFKFQELAAHYCLSVTHMLDNLPFYYTVVSLHCPSQTICKKMITPRLCNCKDVCWPTSHNVTCTGLLYIFRSQYFAKAPIKFALGLICVEFLLEKQPIQMWNTKGKREKTTFTTNVVVNRNSATNTHHVTFLCCNIYDG
jgi:hypothetical protein